MKAFSVFLMLAVSFSLQAQTQPAVKWKFKTDDAIVTTPVIDGDVVYCGSLDKNLYAINLQTGHQLWKFATGAPNRSTPLINGSRLYFLSGDGILYCLDKTTSKQIWQYKTGGEKKYALFAFADHIQSSPVLDGNNIYFGSGDGNIYALSADKGALIWKFATGNVVHATPAIDHDKLLIGSFDGYFYAINKQTGSLIWEFKSVGQRYFPLGEFSGSPAVSGKTVYVGARDFNLYALDIEKGVGNWNRYFPNGWSVSTPVFYKGLVVNGTMDDRIIVGLDTVSGGIAWKTNIKFDIFGSCLVADSTGYFGSLNGKLFAINLNNGTILWQFATDGAKQNHDEYLTADDQFNDHALSILEKDLAAQVPMFYKMGGIFSKPAMKDGLLVFTSSEGVVYCLDVRR